MTRMQGVSRTNSEFPSLQRALLSLVCSDPASAEKALGIIEREGIPASRVNVLVRGGDIEKRWIHDRELRRCCAEQGPEDTVDRILAAAFFRKRPLQAGVSARVISLAGREQGNAKKEREGERR